MDLRAILSLIFSLTVARIIPASSVLSSQLCPLMIITFACKLLNIKRPMDHIKLPHLTIVAHAPYPIYRSQSQTNEFNNENTNIHEWRSDIDVPRRYIHRNLALMPSTILSHMSLQRQSFSIKVAKEEKENIWEELFHPCNCVTLGSGDFFSDNSFSIWRNNTC